jgi:hypothetical protein
MADRRVTVKRPELGIPSGFDNEVDATFEHRVEVTGHHGKIGVDGPIDVGRGLCLTNSRRDDSARLQCFCGAIGDQFNDSGNADVGAYARIELPTSPEKRLLLHKDFQGNPENIKGAIRAHLVNCVKASGPVMSASENQSSRKSEFNQIVEEQLKLGLLATAISTP